MLFYYIQCMKRYFPKKAKPDTWIQAILEIFAYVYYFSQAFAVPIITRLKAICKIMIF